MNAALDIHFLILLLLLAVVGLFSLFGIVTTIARLIRQGDKS